MTARSLSSDGQRIDTWLWHARLFKTRTLAAAVVSAGKVRLTRNGKTARVAKTSHQVRPGDTLTFPKGRLIRIVCVTALAVRRGPAAEAQALYEDLIPPPPLKEKRKEKRAGPVATREPGAGRPTKKERRATDRLRGVDPGEEKEL